MSDNPAHQTTSSDYFPEPVGLLVHCVICIDPGVSEVVHIFSTAEKAEAYADADEGRVHVLYDYVVDVPERMENPRQ